MNSMLPFTTVFSFTLVSSTLIALSSSHWLLTWMALELNLLSFIPLMSLSSNHQETEAAIKYFLAQAAGSALFLFSALWNYFSPLTPVTLITLPLFMAALMLKLGAAPLHFWFPSVMAGLKWIPCLILSTWQKIIPLAIISSIASAHSLMVQMVGALSAITGGLGGLNQSSLRPLLAYSSIGHLGWMLTISMYNLSYTLIYFIIYTMILTPLIIMLNALNMTNIRQSTSLTHSPPLTQVTLLITLLSLGGLPPLTGFISKWLVIEQMTLSPQSTVTLMMLLIGSLMNLFYYLNICFSLTLVPPLTMTTPSTASPLSTTSLPAITFFTMMAPYVAMAMYFFSMTSTIAFQAKSFHPKEMMIRQPFHLVELSPWPITGSLGAFFLTVGLAAWFHSYSIYPLILGFVMILLTMVQWWRDVIREATFMGHHTSYVTKGLRWGMVLFIASEVLFFFAFFWAFFHSSLAPSPELGCNWPPTGIEPLNPFAIPLLNTTVLLASAVTITWAHHALMGGTRKEAIAGLVLTVSLGAYFTVLQAGEYMETSFTIADSVYGSTFFVATGFHGLHVLIGSSFLLVCLIRVIKFHFSPGHHFGFEAAAWYWHFVDVVWIFLYLCIYWWGS